MQSTELVHWLDTPRVYVNDYDQPRNGATPVRIPYLDWRVADAAMDAARADYGRRVGYSFPSVASSRVPR